MFSYNFRCEFLYCSCGVFYIWARYSKRQSSSSYLVQSFEEVDAAKSYCLLMVLLDKFTTYSRQSFRVGLWWIQTLFLVLFYGPDETARHMFLNRVFVLQIWYEVFRVRVGVNDATIFIMSFSSFLD
jgi:hypothetical protein